MATTPENERRLEALENASKLLQVSVESIRVGQGFQGTQLTSLMTQLEKISDSLNDPNQSALGRALSEQINGCSSRFDRLLKDQKDELDELRSLVTELHNQSEQMKGALGLIKFVGFSALASGVGAVLLILLQLFQIIAVKG